MIKSNHLCYSLIYVFHYIYIFFHVVSDFRSSVDDHNNHTNNANEEEEDCLLVAGIANI